MTPDAGRPSRPMRDVSSRSSIGECDHCGGNAHSLLDGEHIWKCSEIVPKGPGDFPEIVCLCGSTRFRDEYRSENARLTLEGKVVLSVGFFHHSGDSPEGVADEVEAFEQSEEKADLDALHKRKIDLADRIHVVNVGGYVGESTQSEIRYARSLGKDISWYEEPGITDTSDTATEQEGEQR